MTVHPGPLPPHLLLFDGVCNLCNGLVRFIIRHDRAGRFHFASLGSEVGRDLLRSKGLDPATVDTLVYWRNGRVLLRSSAALNVVRDLGGAWSLLYGFSLVPRFIRDAAYALIARNRYRWFGKRKSCMVAPYGTAARFLS